MSLTIIQLPVDSPVFTKKVTLTGVDYLLRFDYHERQDRWFFGLYTADGVPIRVGMKVVCDWNVLRCCALASRPPGRLLFFSDNNGAAPGFAALGRTCSLMYLDNAPGPSSGQ